MSSFVGDYKDLPEFSGMKRLVFLLLFFACTQPDARPMRTLTAINYNLLVFSDGTTLGIPHWGETGFVTFFFVRHAERLMDGSKDPELTAEGTARAARLGQIMENCRIDSIYATPYKRTQQTAEPLLQHGKYPSIITYLPEKQIELLDKLLPSSGGKTLFIVGHQNTVPMSLNYLKGDFSFRNIADFDFGKFYIAVTNEIGNTEILTLDY